VHGSSVRTAYTGTAGAVGSMDDLDDWLDREAGLAALQGVCEGVSPTSSIPEAFERYFGRVLATAEPADINEPLHMAALEVLSSQYIPLQRAAMGASQAFCLCGTSLWLPAALDACRAHEAGASCDR
jgi:hypothetical protein